MQFEIETVYVMTESIRTVILPLLIISYVCGLRIIEFPVGHPRIWFSLLYMLLLWSTYFFLFKSTVIFYFINATYNIVIFLCVGSDVFITLLSIMFGLYHDKKFRNCLRKLDIIDSTLLNIGTKTDYHKLYKRTIYIILGLLVLIALMTYATAYWLKQESDYDLSIVIYAFSMRTYCCYINIINDVIIASIFGNIGLKFDQVNQLLLDLIRENKCGIKRVWEKSMQRHVRFSQTSNKKWMIWIIIHLHFELRKISREMDSIFGAQMTFKMACNFCWLAFDLRELFRVILTNNYRINTKYEEIIFIVVLLIWLFHNLLKLFFINYICETVSTKANATGNLINKIPYSTRDIEIRENILQFLLQITQTPVRFYGIGLFQCGYKFFYGFSASITTVVVLLVQAYIYN